MTRPASIFLVVLIVAAVGCGSKKYYIVNDPFTGKTYYTRDIDRFNSGNVSFKDDKTRKAVSIQNSVVLEVTDSEYQNSLNATNPAAVPAHKPALPPVAPTR